MAGLSEQTKNEILDMAQDKILAMANTDTPEGEVIREFPEAATDIYLAGIQTGAKIMFETIKKEAL